MLEPTLSVDVQRSILCAEMQPQLAEVAHCSFNHMHLAYTSVNFMIPSFICETFVSGKVVFVRCVGIANVRPITSSSDKTIWHCLKNLDAIFTYLTAITNAGDTGQQIECGCFLRICADLMLQGATRITNYKKLYRIPP